MSIGGIARSCWATASAVRWKPGETDGRIGGVEVWRTQGTEFPAGEYIRRAPAMRGLGWVNGRSVDNGTAPMETRHPQLAIQKSFYTGRRAVTPDWKRTRTLVPEAMCQARRAGTGCRLPMADESG